MHGLGPTSPISQKLSAASNGSTRSGGRKRSQSWRVSSSLGALGLLLVAANDVAYRRSGLRPNSMVRHWRHRHRLLLEVVAERPVAAHLEHRVVVPEQRWIGGEAPRDALARQLRDRARRAATRASSARHAHVRDVVERRRASPARADALLGVDRAVELRHRSSDGSSRAEGGAEVHARVGRAASGRRAARRARGHANVVRVLLLEEADERLSAAARSTAPRRAEMGANFASSSAMFSSRSLKLALERRDALFELLICAHCCGLSLRAARSREKADLDGRLAFRFRPR